MEDMTKIYTKEMRASGQDCPICGFWHSALSCPPQVGAMSIQILSLRADLAAVTAERDKLREAINRSVGLIRGGTLDEEFPFRAVPYSMILDKVEEWLASALQESTDDCETYPEIYAETRLMYKADTVTLKLQRSDRGDYLLVENMWRYSCFDNILDGLEELCRRRRILLSGGYVEIMDKESTDD